MSFLPNEISFDITNFLPNDDITDLMHMSKNFNAHVTPRLKKIDEKLATMNQSIQSFMPEPTPVCTDNDWIRQLNLKRFVPIGSVAKNRMKQLFRSREKFVDCFGGLNQNFEWDVGTFNILKQEMSLERFDDKTFVRILFALVFTKKFRQEYNISEAFLWNFMSWFEQFLNTLRLIQQITGDIQPSYTDLTRIYNYMAIEGY